MLHPNSNEGSVIDFYLFACNTFFVKLVEDAYKSVNIEPTILIALFQCLYFSFISQSIFFLSKTKTDLIFFYSSSLGNEAAECTVCMVKL